MTTEEIKEACERARFAISSAKEILDNLQKICPHSNTYEGLWSWRIGSTQSAIICSDCGSLIKFKGVYLQEFIDKK